MLEKIIDIAIKAGGIIMNIREKGIETLKYPIHILKDGQGMFCEDGTCRFIGDEEEVNL